MKRWERKIQEQRERLRREWPEVDALVARLARDSTPLDDHLSQGGDIAIGGLVRHICALERRVAALERRPKAKQEFERKYR